MFYLSSYGVALAFHVRFIHPIVVFTSYVLFKYNNIYIRQTIYMLDITILNYCDAYNLSVFLFYDVMLPVC